MFEKSGTFAAIISKSVEEEMPIPSSRSHEISAKSICSCGPHLLLLPGCNVRRFGLLAVVSCISHSFFFQSRIVFGATSYFLAIYI
jgi:hypothetical protein